MFGFLRLLRHLVAWGMDLQVQDHMGLTALHYAYFYQQQECIVFLLRSGASRFVLDHLGRPLSDMEPPLDKELGVSSVQSSIGEHSDTCSSHRHQMADDELDIVTEAEMLNAKYLLVERWIQQVENGHCREFFSCRRNPSQDTRHLRKFHFGLADHCGECGECVSNSYRVEAQIVDLC